MSIFVMVIIATRARLTAAVSAAAFAHAGGVAETVTLARVTTAALFALAVGAGAIAREYCKDVAGVGGDIAKSLPGPKLTEAGRAGNRSLSQSLIDEILGTPKGQRPDPSSYMSQADIDVHLAQFDGGAVRFASADDVAKYGTAGPPNGGFVVPKSEFDNLVREAGGDMRVVERRLGLDSGSLSSGNTVALEIKPQDMNNLRVPSGNEGGANSQWVPGGYTSGGVPEAVMDFSGVPFTPIEF